MIKESICQRCNNKFEYEANDNKKGKYCSRLCFGISIEKSKCNNCNKNFSFPKRPCRPVVKFCSTSCYFIYRQHNSISLKDNYERFVIRGKTENDCYDWNGPFDKDGYTRLYTIEGKKSGHRVAYILEKGSIPKGKHILHNCPNGDNKRCTNIRHLWLGNQLLNNIDAFKKGRMKSPGSFSGSRNSQALLNEEQVKEIRKLIKEKLKSYKEISQIFGIAKTTISGIIRYKTWKHVTLDPQ